MSEINVPINVRTAINIKYPIKNGKSLFPTASKAALPNPGIENIPSVIIAPANKLGIDPPINVTIGINVFLNPCFPITYLSANPLARAVLI